MNETILDMEELKSFHTETYFEFECIADCIWKFNQHIESLRRLELGKLEDYFPDNKSYQEWRWKREAYKLDQVFPNTLNYSFVVFVYIEIETRLMRLCDLLYKGLGLPIRAKELKGSGIECYIDYLAKFLKINKTDLKLWSVILNLVKIRNCIVHTNGYVAASKDNSAIMKIIENEHYLADNDRNNPRRKEKLIVFDDFDVEKRLKIDMHYPFLLCSYAREFFSQLILTINNGQKPHNHALYSNACQQ